MAKKIIIIIRGAPAAGKSTLARNLVNVFKKHGKTSLLIPDEFKWVMTAHDNRDAKDFSLAFSNYAYTLTSYLKAGYTVITEDTWDKKPFTTDAVARLGKKYNYTIYQFLLTGDWKSIKHQNTLRPMVLAEKQLRSQYKLIYDKRVSNEIVIDIANKKPDRIAKEVISHISL